MAEATPLISYAQNGEDIILRGLLDDIKKGFYVDVGANYPTKDSVTKLFYLQGWHGINIEPSPRLHGMLAADRPRDINLMVGVADKKGELLFRDYEYGDGLSTFSAEMQKMYEQTNYYFASTYKEYQVEVTMLKDIFAKHAPATIDFLKVDIEGYEYEALVGNDWQKYRPRVLCIEANHIIRDWHKLVRDAGYTLVYFDGLNEYFVRNEDEERIKSFSYPDKILLGGRYVTWDHYGRLVDLEREKRHLQVKVRSLEYKLAEALTRPALSPGHRVSARLKHIVTRTIRSVDRSIEHRLAPAKVVPVADGGVGADAPLEAIARGLAGIMETSLRQQYPRARQLARRRYRSIKRAAAGVRKKR